MEKKECPEKQKDSELKTLEKTVDRLSQRVKKLAKKNGFSKTLKKKVALEL